MYPALFGTLSNLFIMSCSVDVKQSKLYLFLYFLAYLSCGVSFLSFIVFYTPLKYFNGIIT